MSEITELAVIEKSNAMTIFTQEDNLEKIVEEIEKTARSLVADVNTAKGRDAIRSNAANVARSKTLIDNAGKDLVAELKALPKQIDESRRKMRDRLDALKDEVRKPLTEWEAEQERIKAEEAMNAMHVEALEMNAQFDIQRAAEIEQAHEMALLMNDAFDRQREEARLAAEKAQREHEAQLQRDAEEKAKREAEQKHQAEIEAAARREAEAIAARERAERERIEAEQRAEREKKEAAERAERERQQAIADERRKAQEEADRIRRENEAKERARLAEEKRIADENARRAADIEHRRTIDRKVISDLVAQGIPQE